MTEQTVFRIACTVEGHENEWIEFETKEWTLEHFDMLAGGVTWSVGMAVVKDFSCGWNLTGDEGVIVPHPGMFETEEKWKSVFKALGTEGLKLSHWLVTSSGKALLAKCTPKSPDNNNTVEDNKS